MRPGVLGRRAKEAAINRAAAEFANKIKEKKSQSALKKAAETLK